MVHFILEDHGGNQKGTQVPLTHNLLPMHLGYPIPTSNAIVTYGAAQRSTYRLHPRAEGTAYTVYMWAQYNDRPGPTWHQDPAWHQPSHGKRVPRQGGTKPTGNKAPAGTTHNNIINSALANARMPLIDTGCPALDDTTHCRTWGTIRQALQHDIGSDQATWLDQGFATIRAGGCPNSLNTKKLGRVAGPYILYRVPHGMDGPCPGLRPVDPQCWHPCPHSLFQPLPPQPAPLHGIYLNTVPGAKGVYLTAGDILDQAIPLHQIQHVAMGRQLPGTTKQRHPLAGHGQGIPQQHGG